MPKKYQSINIIMEDDDDDRNTKRPSEIYVNTNTYNSLDSNGRNDDDETSVASIVATDTTFLLNKRTDIDIDIDADIETNYTRSSHTHSNDKKREQYKKTNNDNGKEMIGTLELKNAIQRKPCLSAYIMFSTLFFGFAVGFSTGFLASEKKLFHSSSITTDDNDNNNKIQISNNEKMGKTADTLSKFIENDAIFQDISSQKPKQQQYHHQQQQQKQQQQYEEEQSPLLRFPFQTGTSKPRPLIYLNRQDAYTLLVDGVSASMSCTMSPYTGDFFIIQSGLDAQVNQAYCGIATAAAILNSLRFYKSEGFDVPLDPSYAPYTYATQRDIFNECTEKHVIRHSTSGGSDIDGVLTAPYGLSVLQIADMLRCSLNTTNDSGIGWNVQEQYVDSSHITASKMRFDMKKALLDTNSRVLVNYDRSAVGQEGGGHWSPVGSYSEKRDAFLIMDVAKYKYPPVWIPSERLFDGLATYDNCGSWNFPDAQDSLSQQERMSMPGDGNYASAMKKLGCEKKLRGYITVTRTSTE